MKIELIDEPKIEFGNDFLCDDPKMGLSVGSFFSLTNKSHHTEIHYGIIGTKNDIELINDWIKKLNYKIEASSKTKIITTQYGIDEEGQVDTLFNIDKDINLSNNEIEIYSKKLNPDFPGLGVDSVFKCCFINDPMNNIKINSNEINKLLDTRTSKLNKLEKIIKIYIEAYKTLLDKSILQPDICFVLIDDNVFNKLSSIKIGNQSLNLRRRLKAEFLSIPKCIPVQIILESTIKGEKKSIQDFSMITWNFMVAQYYKSGGIPWALTTVDKNSCYIGISFHKILNKKNDIMRSSIAQAFNYEGKGLIFIGDQFEWDSKIAKSKMPHLKYEYAKNLIEKILEEYKSYNEHTSSRIVIHKTTNFWTKAQSEDFCESEGFIAGIKNILGINVEINLVTLRSSKIKLYRLNGKYPVIRGTLLKLNDKTGILYTTGYIPYYETFPGVHTPSPLRIDIYYGESTIREISKELLAFSKMNFNNCNYFDSLPITIRFAKKVGEIAQYFGSVKNFV